MRTPALLLFIALAALLSPPAGAEDTVVDIEAGYQWVEVEGNQDLYRTQVDEADGFVLRGFSLTTVDSSDDPGLFDRLRIDASGFGGSPSGRFSLSSGLARTYRLRLSYLHLESFSALPGFANPFLDQGVVPGQHTWERDRDLVDLELELLPGRTFTPIVGYSWNRYQGPRRTTYFMGEDEFQLASDLDETEQEFRAGLSFAAGHFHGTLIQGWRDSESSERLALVPGAGAGNDPGEVLGHEVSLDAYSRKEESEAETPVTRAHVAGTVGDSLDLTATFVHADSEGETRSDEALTGSLVSFTLSRFFAGLDESVRSSTENPAWRGELTARYRLGRTLSLDGRFLRHHRELEGWALVSSLYLETLNFSGADPRDISRLVEAETGYERDEQLLDLRLTAHDVGPFTFWAAWNDVDQELDLEADVAEIIIPGGQSGLYERGVSRYAFGFDVSGDNAELSFDWGTEDADTAVVRTDFLERDRVRARFSFRPGEAVRVTGTAEIIEAENGAEGIGFSADTEHYAVDLEVTPVDAFGVRVAYDSYDTSSEVTVRRPEDFGLDLSLHAERGEVVEAGIMGKAGSFTYDAGYSTLENRGSFGFELDRIFSRLGVDFTDTIGASVEVETWDYREQSFTLADFDSTRYGVYLRWHR